MTRPGGICTNHRWLSDQNTRFATCLGCRRLFEASTDSARAMVEVNCGVFNCHVDEVYGFVPEAGCPVHDP